MLIIYREKIGGCYMKKRIIALAIAFLTIGSLYGCGSKENNKEINEPNSQVQKEVTEPAETKEIKEDNTPEVKNTADTKRVGKENYGFVEVPSEWIDFKDVSLPDDTTVIQYSDPVGSSIITMNISNNYEQSADNAAQAVAQKIQDEGVKATGATVQIGGYKAYQVYGKYENEGIILVTWFFKDENNTLHYISAEGKENDILNVVGY